MTASPGINGEMLRMWVRKDAARETPEGRRHSQWETESDELARLRQRTPSCEVRKTNSGPGNRVFHNRR